MKQQLKPIFRAYQRACHLDHVIAHRFPAIIQLPYLLCHMLQLLQIRTQQIPHGIVGICNIRKPSRRIQLWHDLKGDQRFIPFRITVIGQQLNRLTDALTEVLQSELHNCPCFLTQRHHIGNGGNTGQHHMLLYLPQQCTGNLQRNAGSGQCFKAFPHQKRMQQIQTGEFLIHGMMIRNDYIHPSVSCLRERIQCLHAVINGDQQAVPLFMCQLHRMLLQTVALCKAVRYIKSGLYAIAAQRIHKNRCRANAVRIIISAYHDPLLILLRLIDALCNLLHSVCRERVCQLRLLQKLSYLFIL